MYLYIDNSEDGKMLFVSFSEKQTIAKKEYKNNKQPPAYFLDKFLSFLKKDKKDIKGIAVRLGVGRFTATRILTTFANTLAYSLKIPVIGVFAFSEKDLLTKFKKAKAGVYVSASYSAPPHIDGKQN